MILRLRLLSTLLLSILLCLLSSCEKTFLRSHTPDNYHCYQSPDASAWHRRDTLSFLVPPFTTAVSDHPSQTYRLDASLRLIDSYPYQDLQLYISVEELMPLCRRVTLHKTLNPQGDLLHSDTLVTLVQPIRKLAMRQLHFDIYDAKDMPRTPSLTHLLTQQTIDRLQLNPRHYHRIRITHRMRLDPLPGISDVGIHLSPVQP